MSPRQPLLLLLSACLAWQALAFGLDRHGLSEPEAEVWELAVVAGCRVMPGGLPSDCLAARTDAAVDLYRSGRVGTLLFTGGVGTHPPSEAEVGAARARAAGVPEHAILLEDRSTSTLENAALARELVDEELGGAEQIVVITDAYHTLRARRVFAAHFEEVDSLGVRSPLLVRVRGAHREVLALGWYALRGRL